MAILIDIKIVATIGDQVEYPYCSNDHIGRFHINVRTGETTLINTADGEVDERLYQRAAQKIKVAWRDGELPEVAVWAS